MHDDTLTPDNRQKFIRTTEKYHQTLNFINVTEHVSNMDERIKNYTGATTIGTMYRLLLPELLDIDKIIYLDCDVVVNLDINDLWHVNLNGNCIAGIRGNMYKKFVEVTRDKLMGINHRTYVNAGVLVMNLAMIRKNGVMIERAAEWYRNHLHLLPAGDQDIINALYTDSIELIDKKFNNTNPRTAKQYEDSIIHTPTRDNSLKTWGMSGLYYQELYWRYYFKSAWGENKSQQEIIDIMLKAVSASSMEVSHNFHRSSKQCLRTVINRIIHRIFYENMPVMTLRFLFMDITYRIKRIFSHNPAS